MTSNNQTNVILSTGTTDDISVQQRIAVIHRRVAAYAFRTATWITGDEEKEVMSSLLVALKEENREIAEEDAKVEWTECRCRVHQPVACRIVGAEGCRGDPYGKHPAIRALYAVGHRACLVEPGVRALDRKLFDIVEFGEGRSFDLLRKFGKGNGTNYAGLGAGYCYAPIFPDSVTMRVARIVGPDARKLRVLRYAMFLGREYVEGFQAKLLKNGDVHIECKGTERVPLHRVILTLLRMGDNNSLIGSSAFGSSGALGRNSAISGALTEMVSIVRVARLDEDEIRLRLLAEHVLEDGPSAISLSEVLIATPRALRLKGWFALRDIDLSDVLLAELVLATASGYTVGDLRERCEERYAGLVRAGRLVIRMMLEVCTNGVGVVMDRNYRGELTVESVLSRAVDECGLAMCLGPAADDQDIEKSNSFAYRVMLGIVAGVKGVEVAMRLVHGTLLISLFRHEGDALVDAQRILVDPVVIEDGAYEAMFDEYMRLG